MLIDHKLLIPILTLVLATALVAATQLALALDRYRFRNGVMLGIGLSAAAGYRAVGFRIAPRCEGLEITTVAILAVLSTQLVRQLLH